LGAIPAARFPPVAVVTLVTPARTIRQAMTAAGLPIDPAAARGVLALPVYVFTVNVRQTCEDIISLNMPFSVRLPALSVFTFP